MRIVSLPSPNFDSRDGQAVDMLVLHYTNMPTAKEALARLCDPAAKVSAHYLIDEDGAIYHLVNEDKRAWHAGVSFWRGHTNINQRSIGIELANPGHEFGYRPFPAAQMNALITLCKVIVARHPIPPRNVVGHSDVAPARKDDPGELFDWKRMAKEGIGLWPEALSVASGQLSGKKPPGHAGNWQLATGNCEVPLRHYGYETTDLPKAITAFQRHFRPKLLNGQWDSECAGLLAGLLAIM